MKGDLHVRFCERLEGKFLRPTRPLRSLRYGRKPFVPHFLHPPPNRTLKAVFPAFFPRTSTNNQQLKFSSRNKTNKKKCKDKFQADKDARVYKRLVPLRPCIFAAFHLKGSFLFLVSFGKCFSTFKSNITLQQGYRKDTAKAFFFYLKS